MRLEVDIKYCDKNGTLLRSETMPFNEYTALLRNSQQRVIGDVERLIYATNGNKPRSEWDSETLNQYALIRRQLLDTAGDIGRLPEDVHEHIPTSEENVQAFWSRLFP